MLRTVVFTVLAFFATFAAAQESPVDRLSAARTEVNTTQNAASRSLYAVDQIGAQPPDIQASIDKARSEINETENAAARALYALDKALGIYSSLNSPVAVDLNGAPPIIGADVDPAALLHPSWGSGAIAADNGADPVGAFRFICGAGPVNYDDPVVYPGKPGASHLHQYYGNTGVNANTTYVTLATTGDSTCGNKLNRSGYWMPALLDGKGHVVEPDYVSIYYKRLPVSDPHCNDPARVEFKAEGICVPVPQALRFIFGYDFLTHTPATGHHHFACVEKFKPGATADTLAGIAAAGCPAGSHVEAMISAPTCWDGKNLDSANHRDHVSYAGYGGWGYLRCDAAHPYLIPTFTLGSFYAVNEGDDLSLWRFSSDEMAPGAPAGTTFHADFFSAWHRPTLLRWTAGCINNHENCSGGDLGDGSQLNNGGTPLYDGKPSFVNPHARIPVPPRP